MVLIGFFTVLGGVFTAYKFINMILDRRDKKIFREIKRLESIVDKKADKTEVTSAVDRVCAAVVAMGKEQRDFVGRMDKHVETFYDHNEVHTNAMHKLELKIAGSR